MRLSLLKFQEIVNRARGSWNVNEEIKLELDNEEIEDPFTLGYIITPKPILYLRAKQIRNLKPPKGAIIYCIYHEMGHFKQHESNLFRRFDKINLIKSVYHEFTNEVSTIILLCKNNHKDIVLTNARYYANVLSEYKKKSSISIKTLLEYYPYVYAYDRAGKILNDAKIRNCYVQIIKLIKDLPIDNLYRFFNKIGLWHWGPVYYIQKNLDKELKRLQNQLLWRPSD